MCPLNALTSADPCVRLGGSPLAVAPGPVYQLDSFSRRTGRLGGALIRQAGSHRRDVVTCAGAGGREAAVATTVPEHRGGVPAGTLRAAGGDCGPAWGRGWLR
jgi:hypothetical protein